MLPAAAVGISISLHGMPFLFPFHPNILLNGVPALMIGSMNIPHPDPATLIVAPDVVKMGIPTVLFNGIPAITVTSFAKHIAGTPAPVMTGWPNILIGI